MPAGRVMQYKLVTYLRLSLFAHEVPPDRIKTRRCRQPSLVKALYPQLLPNTDVFFKKGLGVFLGQGFRESCFLQ